MNLYLIERVGDTDWEEYYGAVVAAKNEEQARYTYPGVVGKECERESKWNVEKQVWEHLASNGKEWWRDDWVNPKDVKVALLGRNVEVVEVGAILSDFKRG